MAIYRTKKEMEGIDKRWREFRHNEKKIKTRIKLDLIAWLKINWNILNWYSLFIMQQNELSSDLLIDQHIFFCYSNPSNSFKNFPLFWHQKKFIWFEFQSNTNLWNFTRLILIDFFLDCSRHQKPFKTFWMRHSNWTNCNTVFKLTSIPFYLTFCVIFNIVFSFWQIFLKIMTYSKIFRYVVQQYCLMFLGWTLLGIFSYVLFFFFAFVSNVKM
jgi:hypothetical protein